MKSSNIFMTGNWEDLVISTFEVDQKILEPYLPENTEIDFYKGKALMSMVAFTFSNVKFFGVKVPFHQRFGQINFRFYAKSKIDGTKGVVFIKEFAPKPLIASVANTFYNEPYFYKSIGLNKVNNKTELRVSYTYKDLKVKAIASNKTKKLEQNSLEHFVVDRYVAFIKNKKKKTIQYKINHRPWNLYKVKSINIDNGLLTLLPSEFKNAKLLSTYFADGSFVTVEKGIPQDIFNKKLILQKFA